MSITAALVLFSVIWFLVFFVVLQLGSRSQADAGSVVPGTPAGAPAEEGVGRKARITTMFAAVIFAVVAGIILSGWISIRDLDVFERMGPASESAD